jgi:hypothetical protein
MTKRERKQEDRIRSVKVFVEKNAQDFPPESYGGELAAKIRADLAELDAIAVSIVIGDSEKRTRVVGKGNQAAKLRELMRLVTKTARVLGVDDPGFHKRYLMPRAGTDFELLHTAKTFLLKIPEDKTAFRRFELTEAFWQQLTEAVNAFEEAIKTRQRAGVQLQDSTFRQREILARLADTLRRLDVWARNVYRDKPRKLEAWEKIR